MQEIYKSYETAELVVMYQSSHNENYLQEIIRRNSGLLHKWVWDYRNIPYHDEDDLLQEGYIALCRAVDSYSLERGVAFSTYLKTVVHQHYNRIYTEATRQKRFTGVSTTSWEELVEIHKESSIEFDLLSDMEVMEFINSLDGKVQYIAIRLLQGYSKGDIARALGITPASTSYHIKRLESKAIEYFSVKASRTLSEAI